MGRKFSIYIVAGLAIGAVFGSGMGAANENALLGTGLGALLGMYIGWFIAAAAYNNKTNENE